jgi:hypothetical protein
MEIDKYLPPKPLWTPLPGPQEMALRSEADVIGFGGSAGGGKSFLLLGLAILHHQRSLILRREAKQTRGFMEEVREHFPGIGRLNENTGIWRDLPGGRVVEFGGVKDPGDEQAYKGRPRDLLGIDEADLFTKRQVQFLQGWVRTRIPGQRCRTVLTFNPPSTVEGRWLLEYFGPWIDEKHPNPAGPGEVRWFATLPDGREVERPNGEPFVEGKETIRPLSRTFIPSRVTDNPYYMATNYIAVLQALPEPLRSQLLYGDMRAGIQDDAWQLIPTEWVRLAQARWTENPPEGQALTAIGADVAHGGADKTVVAPKYGAWFAPLKKYQGRDTDSGEKAAHLIMREMPEGSDAPVNVDAIGYGSECHAELKKIIGKRAIAVNVGSKPDPPVFDRSKKYELGNVRAAMFWKLREAFDPVNGDDLMLPPDPELLGDLTAMKFEVKSGRIFVEKKEDIKQRLGRSPDCADAVALAHWRVKLWKLTADMFGFYNLR